MVYFQFAIHLYKQYIIEFLSPTTMLTNLVSLPYHDKGHIDRQDKICIWNNVMSSHEAAPFTLFIYLQTVNGLQIAKQTQSQCETNVFHDGYSDCISLLQNYKHLHT